MKRVYVAAAIALQILVLSTAAFGQGGFFATVTGTVTDNSGGLLPGVTVKATAVDTSVVTSTLTNDAGAYNFSNLLPGKYTFSASLSSFQTKNITDVQLSQNTSYRYNFQLVVSAASTQVEVTVSGQDILATSGATIGQVLPEQQVKNLPLVGNNVLDLITVLSGVENIAGATQTFGRESTTFAGVGASNITVARDGIMVQDVRYPTGINSATTMNPDLVGEIRLILAPVDAEIGRGNGTIQISTRSGTNHYTGSAVWTVRNTALDPNTWGNNTNQTVPPGSPPGTTPKALQPDWANSHQGTVSFSGPIVRNKTFFFALFDFNRNRSRSSTQTLVLTPCARQGIIRYYDGWNSGNALASTVTTGPTPTRPSVALDGTPLAPATLPNGTTTNPDSTAWSNTLRHISVFGPLPSQPATGNCSDAPVNPSTLVPNGGGGSWDPFRKQIDTTGFISRTLAYMPLPNNYETGDGLNTAGFRWLRHFSGLDNLWGVGEATGNRTQYNAKIDQNFGDKHKANINLTYERVSSDDVVAAWPDTFSNQNFRHPLVITAGFTSTITPAILNEARFGLRKTGTHLVAPWDRSEADIQSAMKSYLPPQINGFLIMPRFQGGMALCYPHSGVRPPGGCAPGFFGAAASVTNTGTDDTPVYTFADTLSWTHGNHAFKFGGELRLTSSEIVQSGGAFFSEYQNFVQVNGGTIVGTAPGASGPNDLNGTNPAMRWIQTTDSAGGRNIMNLLAASVGASGFGAFAAPPIGQLYFMTDPNNTTTWSDYRNDPFFRRKIEQREFSAFVKDDYKITRTLTLNLGLRWEYYGVPWIASGLTVAPVGGSAAAFGISGRDFTGWMNPGVRGDLTNMEFVGPSSPNPDRGIYKKEYNNFGPAVGFAWQVPWFGEGKTTLRGGYQVTYQGAGRFDELHSGVFDGPNFYPGPLGAPPGSTASAAYNPQNVYLDLSNINPFIPVPTTLLPMQPLPLTSRTTPFSVFDPNRVSPYVQNLTLSITRNVNKNVTVDLRYIGTLAKKQRGVINLNSANFLYNGLLENLNQIRTGTETTVNPGDPLSLLDKMFAGMNLCGFGCTALPAGQTYGPIGQVSSSGQYQTAALQMRSSTTFQTNLATGNYVGIASSINTLSDPALFPAVTGSALAKNNFPANFVATNPQFGTLGYFTNINSNNYHALQAQVSVRPLQGISAQATYSWSKNLGLGAITNPAERSADYTNVGNNPGHSLRTNSTFELPMGPNKLLFGSSTGFLARVLERWQLGLIYNLSTGAPTSITATNMIYGNGVPDIVYPVDLNEMKGVRWDIRPPGANFVEGRYFDSNDMFVKVTDPQCNTVTPLQGLSANNRCTLTALAMAVAPGTAGAVDRVFPDGQTRPSVVVLQHPLPGKKGTLGNNTVIGLGSWRFDANLGKTFHISESKSLQIRFDALNVLNHPQPATPNLAITGTAPFGQIANGSLFGATTYAKTGGRSLQGQLRLNF